MVLVNAVSEKDRGEDRKKREEEREEFEKLRKLLVEGLEGFVLDEKVLRAMLRVPRHMFVPEYEQRAAYTDRPLEIGHGQTISAPHMVAIMCEVLELSEGHKVLEIGAGSGYNAAVMAELVGKTGHVYTVERIDSLVDFARNNLKETGYDNVTVLLENGSMGYPEYAPYDRIAVTCAAPSIPEPLLEQLKPGGILVIPVGNYSQELIKVKKDSKGNIHRKKKGDVVFVPLIGKYGFRRG
ncbi:Protein-L-isoaspartate O-methyltransferase [Methanosarcina horonobensis HB-1 = JCM 15518]|uniref:Protein-L-isoaspartate O-methyltransferase n=1 Tax=Methanosarcina horonobensis HB-1 = JCM 15518 TaxID=1434110 RepID=A0A0E3SG92_9EURY|nr:protein-L-isoaspartate O-methyltransferase [Methanosarcina horonobensis]AKB80156.1 Protein-L-isoaspartate O-methyltransferase [Methanosarcina horonobensis HB-1 = JCM 15518]